MSALFTIHLAITAVVFVIVFIEGNDEPAFLRIFSAAVIALFWLPGLMIVIAFVALGHVGGWIKALRK